MEAKLMNSSTVAVKWKAPPAKHRNGVLKSYNVIVRGVNIYENISKVLTNITIDSASSSIMLANLTEGVTYTVSVAAINKVGMGPFSQPAILRLDPITKKLDTSFSYRFPLNNDHMDDFLTQPWFIILLGTILVIMMLSFGVMVFIKRKHILMKQSAFNGLAGKHENFVFHAIESSAEINQRNLSGKSSTTNSTNDVCSPVEFPLQKATKYSLKCFIERSFLLENNSLIGCH